MTFRATSLQNQNTRSTISLSRGARIAASSENAEQHGSPRDNCSRPLTDAAMSQPRPFYTVPRDAKVWIRGVFQLPNGRQITRTVRRDFIIQPGDDERPAIMFNDLWEELRTAGHNFAEGHGTLVEILGGMPDGWHA
jgi:hypothetical protein